PTLISHLRQPRCILSGVCQLLLIFAELAVLTVRDQRVRDAAESLLNGLPVYQQHLLLLCFAILHAGLDPSAGEYGLHERATECPESRRSSEQAGKCRAGVSGVRGQRNVWVIGGLGDADVCVGRDKLLLRLANIGSPLQ